MLDDDLDYQSEEALTFLGQVIGEQERFDEFEAVAKQMGSRAWKRIIRLADITPASKFRMLLHTNPKTSVMRGLNRIDSGPHLVKQATKRADGIRRGAHSKTTIASQVPSSKAFK